MPIQNDTSIGEQEINEGRFTVSVNRDLGRVEPDKFDAG